MICENTIRRTATISKTNIAVTVALFSLWVMVIFLISGYLSSASAEPDKGFIRKVRTFDLEFLDISNPAGLAYSPSDKNLFVVEDTQSSVRTVQNKTLIKAISLTEEKLTSKELPVAASNPGNITFDQGSRSLIVSEPGKNRLVQIKSAPNGRLATPSTSVDVNRSAVPNNIRGMTSDTLTGRIFFLDADNNEIVSTNSAGVLVAQIDLQETGQTNLKGIAFNPVNKHFYVLSPASKKLFEVTEDGTVENVIDVSGFNLKNPQSMVFAPSGDQTDDPSIMHLYIADSGDQRSTSLTQRAQTSFLTQNAQTTNNSGQILELSLTPAANAVASSCVATLVNTTDTSQFIPPSPDPSGITYEATSGLLVISDGEVEEIPTLFTGDNVFETDLFGTLVTTSTLIPINTIPPAPGATNSEPTGATIDPVTGHFFFTEDNNARVNEVTRNISNPNYDHVRTFSTSAYSSDPEGITFADLGGGQQALFIAEGLGREIYRLDPGVNGVFDGIPPAGDDSVSSFDTASHGVLDPEGIVYNDNGFLYVTGRDNTVLTEFKLSGTVVRTCDISAAAGVKIAGLTLAPGSQNPGDMNLYIVDRGIDNDDDPDENDGRLFEMSIPPLINLAPTAAAGSDQTIILPATANLGGSHTDDGLPDPPFLVTSTWSQQSGPATATIVNPNTENTEVIFPVDGTYVFRLTVNDSQLSDFDDVTVTVLPSGTQTTTQSIPISLGSDDVEEQTTGSVILGSIDIDLVRSGGNQTVGMRFNNVTIPQGTTIVDAYIQFTAQNINSETTALTIEGQAADNALTFVNNVNGDVSTRTRTTTGVSWLPAPWSTVGEAGLEQRTSDLTSVVQEIVNRAGWVSSNSLALIITGTGLRDAESFEANAAAAAVLHLEFANVGGNQPPTASISAPADGSSFTVGDNISFTGTGTDPEDGDVTASLTWDSDLDGAIGTGGSFSTTTLSEGTHTITTTATDSGTLMSSDTISITVAAVGNTPPTASISAPADGSSFTVGDNISFTGTGTDPEDGDVTASLTWASDLDGAIGTSGSFSTTALTEGTHTITATAADSGALTGDDTITVTVLPPGGGTTTLSIPINIGSDDSEEKLNGTVILGSIDIDLVRSGSDQTIGLRFNGVTIPQGATIVDAYIQFTAQNINSGTTALTIEGQAADNTLTFVNNINGNISNRPRTTADIAWSPAPWTTAGDAGLDQRTPNLTPIVQEIVNRAGWVSSNSLALIITGTGLRDAESFEANAAAAAVLHLEFANVGGNQPPTASISTPADGSNFTVGDNISFTGTGTDPEDGDVTTSLSWDSDLDGAIGTGSSFSTTTLSEGTHTITTTATDSGTLMGSDTISITIAAVGNTPPTASISAPADGASFTVGDNISFTGTGTDPEDGDVTASLTWDSDLDGAIGTGGSFSTTALTEGTHAITATATDSGALTGDDTITVTVLPPGGGTTTLSIPINIGSDDSEEKLNGTVVLGSIDIDLVRSGSDQTIGLRFNGVTIPQGATIVDAYIQFTAQNINSGTTALTIEGQAADNTLTFVNNINGNISNRPRTTADIAWSPAPWTSAGDAGLDQRTPNLTPIVQEIVNRAGWVSSNSLALIITGTGLRDAESFEANAAAAAVLHLEFANVGGNQPPTASISAPADGSSFTVGDNISFTGTGTDPEDGDVTASLTWDSDLDGAIGTSGSFSTTTLSEGTHTITTTATDSGTLMGSDTISITVAAVGNTPPTASISAPADGASFTVGDNISFSGTGTDPEDGDVTASLTWESDLDGAIGTGGSFSTTALSEGTHAITATATDNGSLTGDDTISITVAAVGNTPPTASISAPADGSSFTVGDNISFTGTGTDPEDGDVTAS